MNNQMDKTKFLEWLDGEDAAVLWEGPDGLMKYDMLVETINSGEFDPDTPPVPTIKPGDKGYKCSACRESSTSAEWNMETGAYLGIAMHFINLYGKDSDTFVCPKCGEEQPRHMVEVVE